MTNLTPHVVDSGHSDPAQPLALREVERGAAESGTLNPALPPPHKVPLHPDSVMSSGTKWSRDICHTNMPLPSSREILYTPTLAFRVYPVPRYGTKSLPTLAHSCHESRIPLQARRPCITMITTGAYWRIRRIQQYPAQIRLRQIHRRGPVHDRQRQHRIRWNSSRNLFCSEIERRVHGSFREWRYFSRCLAI